MRTPCNGVDTATTAWTRRFCYALGMRARSRLFCVGLWCMSMAVGGCKKSDLNYGTLKAPGGAEAFESRYSVAFDDGYTAASPKIEGRAPNDVADQRLLHARLGHADLVMLVKVEHIWEKGFKGGAKRQFLEIKLGEVLYGELGSSVNGQQLVPVLGDSVPAGLEGERLLMFVRWAPGEEPSFHHHLGPAVPEVVSMIVAMVEHARKEGVLGGSGAPKN
jgi:hypothetical protein